jgi:phosphopantothenoylcysteine decarboxylase/phosphopantothenate--cysteine ligase
MKKIVLGVTGSIAAYKAIELVRLFMAAGNEVRVVMTPAACKFVTPLTFRTLSRNKVYIEEFPETDDWRPVHIELAQWADLVLVAPATANTIAKIKSGIADNLLTSLVLAADCPIAVSPAMNCKMWRNAATQENISVLQQRGFEIIGPCSGELACGVSGEGRFLPPEEIYKAASQI